MVEQKLMPKYGARWHWAKSELPEDENKIKKLQEYIAKQYPVDEVVAARRRLDPKGILGNKLIDTVFPLN